MYGSTPEFKALTEMYGALFEASKKQVLMNRLHFDERAADTFDQLYRGAAVIMANKFLDHIRFQHGEEFIKPDVHGVIDVNRFSSMRQYSQMLTSIRDFIQTGLNGNLGPWKNNGTFQEMYDASQEWHEALEKGDGEVNYQETGKIVKDYRRNGLGLYWVDLETHYSEEECNRMGHCGRTSPSNTLLSLREYKSQGAHGFTINESHLTMALGKADGIVYQLKGPHNQQPSQEYHTAIVDLILSTNLIQGFGSEYDAANDFHLGHLGEKDIRSIHRQKPKLFSKRRDQRALLKYNIIKELPPVVAKNVEIWDREFEDVFTMGRRRDGSIEYFLLILKGENDPIMDGGWALGDLLNSLDISNRETVEDIVEKARKRSSVEITSDDSLEEKIEKLELFSLESNLNMAMESALESAIYDVVKSGFMRSLEDAGDPKDIEIGFFDSQYPNVVARQGKDRFMIRIKKTHDIYEIFGDDNIEDIIADHEVDENNPLEMFEIAAQQYPFELHIDLDWAHPDDKVYNEIVKEYI